MQLYLVDCGSRKVSHIRRILEKLGGEVTTIPLELANQHEFERCSGVVISGGNRLFTDPNTRDRLYQWFAFVETLRVPTLGICLGHQAIALRHGATAYLGPERRDQEAIQVLVEHDLFTGIQSPGLFRTDHCEGIQLPEGFQHLATSDAYAIEAMACLTRPLFGVQFHPEVSGPLGEIMFRNFYRMTQAFTSG